VLNIFTVSHRVAYTANKSNKKPVAKARASNQNNIIEENNIEVEVGNATAGKC